MARDPYLQKHTLNLRKGDWDYLESIFSPQSIPTAVAVRKIISQAVDHFRAQESPADFKLEDLRNE